ncbi:MAG TPA: hypothetical protein VLH75_08055 [Longimicrobiales bacterium]|nr:hypothetical protein [Longimicrobiales bacterium]
MNKTVRFRRRLARALALLPGVLVTLQLCGCGDATSPASDLPPFAGRDTTSFPLDTAGSGFGLSQTYLGVASLAGEDNCGFPTVVSSPMNPYRCRAIPCENGGNCVWWAWHMAHENWNYSLPWPRGDASSWVQGARDAGLDTSQVYSRNTIYTKGNHVAWVLDREPDCKDGKLVGFWVSEMNCCSANDTKWNPVTQENEPAPWCGLGKAWAEANAGPVTKYKPAAGQTFIYAPRITPPTENECELAATPTSIEFALTVTSPATPVEVGRTAIFKMDVRSSGKQGGTVRLDALNLPGNRSPLGTQFTPTYVTVPSGATASSQFTLATDALTPVGTSSFTIRAVSGAVVRTATASFTAVPSPVQPDIRLTAEASSLTVDRGTERTIVVIVRNASSAATSVLLSAQLSGGTGISVPNISPSSALIAAGGEVRVSTTVRAAEVATVGPSLLTVEAKVGAHSFKSSVEIVVHSARAESPTLQLDVPSEPVVIQRGKTGSVSLGIRVETAAISNLRLAVTRLPPGVVAATTSLSPSYFPSALPGLLRAVLQVSPSLSTPMGDYQVDLSAVGDFTGGTASVQGLVPLRIISEDASVPLVIPPTPGSPNPGSTSSPGPTQSSNNVTLSWSASAGATSYSFGVWDMGTNTLVVDVTNHTSTSYTANLSSGRQYRWNVSACNSAGCSSYTTQLYFQTPSAVTIPPTPGSPSPGSTSSPGPTQSSNNVTLSWSASAGATSYSFGVRDMGTNTLVVDVTNHTSTSYTANLSSGRQYRWNVSACNSAGCSSYTTPLYFQTPSAVTIPPTPGNPSPGSTSSPGPTLASRTVTLTWSASSGATSYSFGVRDMGTNTLVVDITNRTGTSYTTTLSAGRQYRWNVSACNSAGCSSYTTPLYFRTP